MVIVDPAPQPKYQVIAEKAAHLRELGLSDAAIARHLAVASKTVKKAVAWARVGRLMPNPSNDCRRTDLHTDKLDGTE